MKYKRVKNKSKYKKLYNYDVEAVIKEVEMVGLYDNVIVDLDDSIIKDIKQVLKWRVK